MTRSKSFPYIIAVFLLTVGMCCLIYLSTDENPLPAGAIADRIIVEKADHRMTLMNGQTVLKIYTVSLGRGGSGAKLRQGDNKTPEGMYHIVSRNVHSHYHRAMKISYPEPRDIDIARQQGNPPGADIMIHGLRNGMGWVGKLQRTVDWTAGCIAVTDQEIEEIWRAVPDGTPIEIKP